MNNYTASTDGTHIIPIHIDGEAITLGLPAGFTYTFTSRGFTQFGGTWLSYGEQKLQVDHTVTSVQLSVNTMVGSASLTPLAPLHYLLPGQQLDLSLTVTTPSGSYLLPHHADSNSTLFEVPLNDFTVEYDLLTGGTLLGSSHRGVRVQATTNPATPDFHVTAEVSGMMVLEGDVVTKASLSTSFSRPLLHGILDSIVPSVTFSQPGVITEDIKVTLHGTADDDVGLQYLRVYMGQTLVGSAHPNEHTAANVGRVRFKGNAWRLDWTPKMSGYHLLEAVATETSGNEAARLVSEYGGPIVHLVTTTDNTGVGSLRQALLNSKKRDVIKFDPLMFNTHREIRLLTSTLTIGHDLTIIGLGRTNLSLSGNNARTVLNVIEGATVHLSGMTIHQGSSSSAAGGIMNNGTLTLDDVRVTGNSAASSGGGIFNSGSLTLLNTQVAANSALVGGGIFNGGSLHLSNAVVTNNTTPFMGSGIDNAPGAIMTGDTSGVTNNSPSNF